MGRGRRRLTPAVADTAPPLAREFFDRPAPEVAPGLLGCVLASVTEAGTVAVRLTEVEAYAGTVDPASHAYRGQTARNAVMFGPPGHAYVYFTYGMHFCVNLVCMPEGAAAAVLLRAGQVIAGEELARSRRPAAASARDLARGPARLCQALGIDRSFDGTDVCGPGSPLRILPPGTADEESVPGGSFRLAGPGAASGAAPQGAPASRSRILSGPRVGVREAADVPWRFWLDGDPTVSAYRPHVPRKRNNVVP